ncbi:MAG TPA: hypothetical protein VHR65_03565 [Solirubrobacterales bacterium]|nr:hypothetical protein [Solirubrobacterales bacterium]
MQDQPTLEQEDMDVAVLTRLCKSGPWTPAELRRELGLPATDAVMRLVEKGLAHRMDGREFVVASQSGRHVGSLGLAR